MSTVLAIVILVPSSLIGLWIGDWIGKKLRSLLEKRYG